VRHDLLLTETGFGTAPGLRLYDRPACLPATGGTYPSMKNVETASDCLALTILVRASCCWAADRQASAQSPGSRARRLRSLASSLACMSFSRSGLLTMPSRCAHVSASAPTFVLFTPCTRRQEEHT